MALKDWKLEINKPNHLIWEKKLSSLRVKIFKKPFEKPELWHVFTLNNVKTFKTKSQAMGFAKNYMRNN